jgi:hypothetical protein
MFFAIDLRMLLLPPGVLENNKTRFFQCFVFKQLHHSKKSVECRTLDRLHWNSSGKCEIYNPAAMREFLPFVFFNSSVGNCLN